MSSLQVELVAAERVVWSGEASFVVARTAEGELGALPGHTPVLSVIKPSVVEITPVDGDKIKAAVEDGFLSIANDRVSILSEEAVMADEIDAEAAKAERDAATPDSLAWRRRARPWRPRHRSRRPARPPRTGSRPGRLRSKETRLPRQP